MDEHQKIRIGKRLQFDAGHRLPGMGLCSNLHGHRFVLEAELVGHTHEGMVLNFQSLKAKMRLAVIEPWDHAFFVWRDDVELLYFLQTLPEHKTVVTAYPPTVEVLAEMAYERLRDALASEGNLIELESVRLFETPSSWAEITSSMCKRPARKM